MSEITLETLAGDIKARLDALGESVPTDEQLTDKIRAELAGWLETEDGQEHVRKIKFGTDSDPELVGTKYARLGLTVADVEWLHDLQVGLQGQKRVGSSGVYEGPSDELAKTFAAVTKSQRVPSLLARSQDEHRIAEMRRSGQLDRNGYNSAMAAIEHVYAAMDTSETGYGAEIVGNQYVGELWAGARRMSRVFGLIEQFDMTDATAFLPVEAALPEMLFVPESGANNSSNYATSKTGSERVQVDAKKFVIHQMWSGEMEEDSIIPYIPFLRRQQAVSLAHYSDSLVLNGDTTNASTGNINLDDADPADTKHYLAFDGIRHAGLVDNTGNGKSVAGAVTLAELSAQRGRMLDTTYLHDWGHPVDPADLVRVADPDTADAIGQLDEVLTVDKYGPQATVLTGEQGRVLNNPLIASIALSKTEADGKVSDTGSNNTKGQVVAFNRRGYVAGVRRRLKVETERLPATDQTRIVLSTRMGFGRFSPTGAASGIESADVLYNISL
jgi:hypothetical protein